MSCAIIIAKGGLGECLSHGWVLKRWRGQMEPLLPGLPGPRWGSWKAARAQAEVKRSRSQGSRHIPRGLPLRWQEDAPSGSKAGPDSRKEQQRDAQASQGVEGAGISFLCAAGGRGACGDEAWFWVHQGMQELEARDTASGCASDPVRLGARPRCSANQLSVYAISAALLYAGVLD